MDYLYDEGLLYVLIGKAYRNVNQTIYVDNDNILAGKEAAEYLLERGHSRIACLSGDHSLIFNNDRKTGYILALTERQIPYRPEFCIEASGKPEEQSQILQALFSREDRPTAALVSDDILAVALEKLVSAKDYLCLGMFPSYPLTILCLQGLHHRHLLQLTSTPASWERKRLPR